MEFFPPSWFAEIIPGPGNGFVSPQGIRFDCTPGGNSPQRTFSLLGNLLKSETVYPQITQRGKAATKEFYWDADERR